MHANQGESNGSQPHHGPLAPPDLGRASAWSDQRLNQLAWAFVGLGVAIRLVRFLLNHPLWGDEAMVAVNVLGRGYRDLLRPLDFFQVCPPLFLWVERAVVDVFGPSERALRLVPTLCSVGSVVLFRHVAGRLISGWALVLAVAIFAVSFNPIRHGGEVKPYAGDLLVSLALIALAVEWWRRPEQTRWLWALAGFVPFALALSHPSVFVAGGISLGLLGLVWKARRAGSLTPFLTYNTVMVAAFLGLFALYTIENEHIRDAYRQGYWAGAFPPLDHPARLVVWLVAINTGEAFAYPVGGERGGSILTVACVLAGSVWLYRQGRTAILAVCLAPFALTMLAAFLGRYPYGGSARTMQHLAPIVCLLAGIGAARLIERWPRPAGRPRLLRFSLLTLAGLGLGMLVLDLARPYRSIEDAHSRAFARWFWPELARTGEVCCVKTERGWMFDGYYWRLGRNELYLTNQEIHAPRTLDPARPRLDRISHDRPLRCVLFNDSPEENPVLASWLLEMSRRLELQDRQRFTVNQGISIGGMSREERYEVFEFVPRRLSRWDR